jgi:hypothetical protein
MSTHITVGLNSGSSIPMEWRLKYLLNYLGWRWAFEQHRQLAPETLLNVALVDFQYLTVT